MLPVLLIIKYTLSLLPSSPYTHVHTRPHRHTHTHTSTHPSGHAHKTEAWQWRPSHFIYVAMCIAICGMRLSNQLKSKLQSNMEPHERRIVVLFLNENPNGSLLLLQFCSHIVSQMWLKPEAGGVTAWTSRRREQQCAHKSLKMVCCGLQMQWITRLLKSVPPSDKDSRPESLLFLVLPSSTFLVFKIKMV